jgi:hypothetical protein
VSERLALSSVVPLPFLHLTDPYAAQVCNAWYTRRAELGAILEIARDHFETFRVQAGIRYSRQPKMLTRSLFLS